MSDTPMSDVVQRFFRYVQVDTQSADEHCDRVPSTACQFDLANLLADELRALGAEDAYVTESCYVVAHIPASKGAEDKPALGLLAHIDTTEAAPGFGVKPHIVHYEGGNLVAGVVDGNEVAIGPDMLSDLDGLVGEDIICSDGSTLLGGDDKAGVAEIMALVARIHEDPSIKHPRLGICFCPDEEIGHGASLLDIPAFGCTYGYTVDGGAVGELEWECFNAAEATVRFEGYSIHPGSAKNRMVNANDLFVQFQSLLPAHMRPEHTDGYDGFIHCESVSATVTHATARYIIRDHDAELFQQKIDLMQRAADFMNNELDRPRVTVEIKQQYRNMAEIVKDYPQLVQIVCDSYEALGIKPLVLPIRGGTDGAQLSFRGLPCPNLGTGGYCGHSVNEFVVVSQMERVVDVLQELARRFAE